MKGRVLVIDDEAGPRLRLTSVLAGEGYDVAACPDGLCAIRFLFGARDEDKPFTHIVTDMFLPDIDGLKILEAARIARPGLPALVIAEFGDKALKSAVLSAPDTAYLDKPFEFADLLKALGRFSPGSADIAAKTDAVADMPESAAAYFTIRITGAAQSKEIFKEIQGMDGVLRCDAVRCDFDIVVAARRGSVEQVEKLRERIAAVRGVEIVSACNVERIKFDPELDEFIRVCSKAVKERGDESPGKQPGRANYIFVDIDKNAVQRIFATVFSSDEVISLDVIEGGDKLVAMIADRSAVGVAPRIIEKLGRIDGVLRVREAQAIRLDE